MAKSYKLKDDSYIDSSGIVHNKTLLKTILNNLLDDTGWIDMSSCINTQYFSARPGYPPRVRKKSGIVYWDGEIYCTTNVGANVARILINIPSKYTPGVQYSNTCTPFQSSTPYNMYIETVDGIGLIYVSSASNITTQNDHQGFQLSNLSGYLV